MRKFRKTCLILSLLLVLSFFLATPAFAGGLINTTSITMRDSGKLKITWDVDGVPIYKLDKGKMTVSLQRYSGSSWVTVTTISVTETNTTCVDNDYKNYGVSTAGKYRLKTVFYAEKDGETDTLTYYSHALNVD
jgi:hypothetical protein